MNRRGFFATIPALASAPFFVKEMVQENGLIKLVQPELLTDPEQIQVGPGRVNRMYLCNGDRIVCSCDLKNTTIDATIAVYDDFNHPIRTGTRIELSASMYEHNLDWSETMKLIHHVKKMS